MRVASFLVICLLASGFALTTISSASAHDPADLAKEMAKREQYFQAVGKPAPGFSLVDGEGRPVHLGDFSDKVVVLNFIYASCTDVCPLHADRIAEIQEMIAVGRMEEAVQFISITTDPSHDTPEVMRAYAGQHGLDPKHWLFLTIPAGAPEDTTRNLARAYGHTFSVGADGNQTHGVVTHVIDRNGQWQANFHGLQFQPVNLVRFVNELMNDWTVPKSWWQRVLDLIPWF